MIVNSAQSTFQHCPAGMHNAVLATVELKENVENKFEVDPNTGLPKIQDKFVLTFQVEKNKT